MTQRRPALKVLWVLVFSSCLYPQEADYQVYTESPRLLVNARRLRLLRRERERESLRWQQFEILMSGKARMAEPGFASALYGIVTGQPGPCRDATDWALKSASLKDDGDVRQMALVYDWCGTQIGEAQGGLLARRLAPLLTEHPTNASAVRSRVFAALAIADVESQSAHDFLRYAAETWWKGSIVAQLAQGKNPFEKKRDLYAMVEILHAVRDNIRIDLREGAGRWFGELPPLQLLSYYPQPWPAPENEFRIPAYLGKSDPDLTEAALSRAAELALVAYDGNAEPHQFLQGWLLNDHFLMRGPFGITYEFLWANPYLPGLSYSYMPDLFHARGKLFVRGGWDESAAWFGYWDGQAQAFVKGQRMTVRLDARLAPVELGPVRVLAGAAGLRFETGWLPPAEEGTKPVEETAFIIGLAPNAVYDVEVDDEEMYEARTDEGGILELRFQPGRRAGVRIRKAAL